MPRRLRVTQGDIERALILLPDDRLFRPAEIFPIARELGLDGPDGQTLWTQLLKRGWIVRTGVPISRPESRRFYWQKTPNIPGLTATTE